MAGAIAVIEAQGLAKLTAARIIARARVSRQTFYELYPDAEACFLAAVDQAFAQTRTLLERAYDSQQGWREGMRAATGALLEATEQHRGVASVCVVDTLAAGPRVRARRAQAIRYATVAIQCGARALGTQEATPLSAHAIAGGIGELLYARLLEEEPGPLTDLHGPIMSMIVLPYLGRAAAREELRICAAAASTANGRPSRRGDGTRDPLANMKIRLTYRTVSVLLAIGQTPGSSNQEVALRAGISDQGQISKLLKRLMSLGLIENLGDSQPSGRKNEWLLTTRGREVARAGRGL
jgi:AcrR family transcriptional regulator